MSSSRKVTITSTSVISIIFLLVFIFINTYTYSEASDTQPGELIAKEQYSELDKLNTAEKAMLFKGSEKVDIVESTLYEASNKDTTSIYGTVALKLPGGSHIVESKSRAYITVKAILGYQNKTFDKITHCKGTFFGGKIPYQSHSVVVKSLKSLYHENGAYRTIGGGQGYTIDYRRTSSFSVNNRGKWQYTTVDRNKYYNSSISGQALETKFTVKGTVNGKAFTITLNAVRIHTDLSPF